MLKKTRLFFVCLLIEVILSLGNAPEQQKVLACLGNVTADWYEPLADYEGTDIWLGYDNGGFDVPKDTYIAVRLRGTGEEGQSILVWVAYSRNTPGYTYWFVFSDTTVRADANGNHYGIHPCGAFRVKKTKENPWLKGL